MAQQLLVSIRPAQALPMLFLWPRPIIKPTKPQPETAPGLTLNTHLARQFFEAIYSSYFKETARPAYIDVRGKREADEDMTFRQFYRSIDLLIKDMDNWPADLHFYFGVAPRWSNTQGKKEHCLALTVIFADVDYGTTGHKKKNR